MCRFLVLKFWHLGLALVFGDWFIVGACFQRLDCKDWSWCLFRCLDCGTPYMCTLSESTLSSYSIFFSAQLQRLISFLTCLRRTAILPLLSDECVIIRLFFSSLIPRSVFSKCVSILSQDSSVGDSCISCSALGLLSLHMW